MNARAASTVLAFVLVTAPSTSHADWPLPRANPQRTGAASGTSDLKTPVPYWRHYLGGAIGSRGAYFADLTGDGAGEVVLVSGGKLVARTRGDALVWQTPVLGISEIVAVSDLDGDGRAEIVVRGSKQVFIIEAATGRVVWEQPADDFGYLGGVRVADLDGDGVDDLLVQECGCCRINNGNTGFMYSFAAGFAADPAAQKAWTMRSVRCGGNKSMAVLDMNGDGRAEVTEGWPDGIAVLDGATGVPVAPVLSLGPRVSESQCMPADVTGNGADELVCLQNSGPQEEPSASHRLFVIEYVPASDAAAPRLRVRWMQPVGEVPRRVYMGAQPVSDLDGDGAAEIVVSGVVGDDWVTYVFDAASGQELASLPDQRVVGSVQLGDGPGATLLTVEDDELRAWAFQRQDAARMQALWSLAGRQVMLEPDWALAARTSVASRIVALDLSGDGVAALLLTSAQGRGELMALDVAGGSPAAVASLALDETVSLLTAWRTPALPEEPPYLLVAPSDGVMRLLDHRLQPVAGGVRFGGYYPRGDWRNLHLTPVVGDLGLGVDSVVISDSRGALIRLDAQEASLAVPPRVAWSRLDTTAPIIVPGLARGAPGIACRSVLRDGSHALTVLDREGAVVATTNVGGQLLSDIMPAELDGDGVPDLIVEWAEAGDLALRHRAYAGATLATLWDTEPQLKGTTRFPAGGALMDWDGDGVDDFVHQYYATQVISGADGSILAESASNGFYFMPIVLQVLDTPRLILQAGFDPIAILDRSLAPLWTSVDDDRPYPYGAVVSTCPDGVPRLVEGSLRHPARVKITELAGPGMGAHTTRVLAGGAIFDEEEEAESAGVFMGQLTATSAHENLMGDGRPVVVVGSEDGWLYALDGCTGELAFTVPFEASVGAIAFGDTDGDGHDEIIVAVADGYLYSLKEPPLSAPAWVIDIDPERGIVNTDVDRIESTTSMSAIWQEVEGADGYEVAVLHASTSTLMTSPAWQPVGRDTRATVTGLSLVHGERYVFVVRALKDARPSPDALSDGVLVDLVGTPAGCSCSIATIAGVANASLLVIVTWMGVALVRRRAR